MYKASDVKSKYGYDPMPLDLSRIPDWERFVQAMNYAMMKQFSALEKGGRMAVLMGDIKKKGKLYSMIAEIVKPGTMENIIIKAQHNCFSDNTQYSGTFIPILHEYVLIVRKDSPTAIPVLMCSRKRWISVICPEQPGEMLLLLFLRNATRQFLLHIFMSR